MANDISTIKARGKIIAKMAAGMLSDKVEFVKAIDKEEKAILEGKNGYKSGDSVDVNVPTRFLASSNADITSTIQDIEEETRPLTLDQRSVVGVALDSKEISTDLGLKDWAKRILEPAMNTISNDIESKALNIAALATSNYLAPQSPIKFDTDFVLQAGELMDISGCSDAANRYLLLNPTASRSAVNERKGLFQSSEEIAKQYKKGVMGIADGFAFLKNNLIASTQNGSDVATVVVDTAPAEGSNSFVVSGLTATTGTVKKGSVFTIDGIFRVHPITKTTLPELMQFTVLEDVTADGSGEATVLVSPNFYSSASGSLQNVSALPVGAEALVFAGAASQILANNMAFHKSAFRFMSAPLLTPDGVDMVAQERVNGITVRVVRQYDIKTDKLVTRLDVLWGLCAVRPEWAVRLLH